MSKNASSSIAARDHPRSARTSLTADFALILVDERGVITSASPATEQRLGHAPAALIGRCWETLLSPDARPADTLTPLFQQARDDGIYVASTTCLRHDGVRVGAVLTITPLCAAAGTVGGFALLLQLAPETGASSPGFAHDAPIESPAAVEASPGGLPTSPGRSPIAAVAASASVRAVAGNPSIAGVPPNTDLPPDAGPSAAGTLPSPSDSVVALLLAAEARYRTMFEYAPVGILLADSESVYLDANPAACQLLGYERNELIGRHASDIVAPTELPQIDRALGEIQSASDHRREWRFRRRDGTIFSADVTATQMPDGTLLGMLRDLSDSQRAHDHHQHLAAIVESSQDAIIGQDLHGVITSWNAGAEAIFGFSESEMRGRAITQLSPEDRRPEAQAIVARLQSAEPVLQFETQCLTKDQRRIDVSISAAPIRDAHGRTVGAATIARNVSTLRERERELERMSRLYAALSQINQAIVWSSNRDELFAQVCRALVEHGGLGLAWIGWHDPATQQLVPVAIAGDETDYLQHARIYVDDRAEGRGPTGEAFRTGRPYICNDVLRDPVTLPWREELSRRGIRASAAFPVRVAGQVAGTLSVYASVQEFFHAQEIALLDEAAVDLSYAMDNFARDDARRTAEQKLRDEKYFSDTMIESMPGILYFYDGQGRFLRWNRNFEHVSGYAAAEIGKKHPLEFFEGEDRLRVESRIADVFTHGESSVEANFVTKSGVAKPYFFTGRRVEFDGQACLVGVGIDISERRRAESQLAESERKYRELVENANSIILRWNAEGRITFLNEFGQRFFGYTSAEIFGRHVTGTIVPPTESGGRDLQALMEEICASPETFEQNINENIRRNGERVWVAWTNRIVRDASGKAREFLSIGTDITARKQAEAELRESRARLVEAQRIAKIGSWEFDIRRGRLSWSDQIYAIFEVAERDFSGTYEAFLDFVHPDDRARLRAAQQAAIAGEARLNIEHRIVLRDGREKVVHELADLKCDAEGRPLMLTGTVHDITDRVRMAAEREQRLRAEAADRIKSAFLATMSHELRTPLNSIIGFTGILLQGLAGPLNPEQNKQLEMVRTSARHLLALVNDVLDISKIEAGQLEVAREPFDIQRSIAKVLALVKPQAAAKRLELRVVVDPELGEARSDERRFEQILLNLLSNAIKFTERGAITLEAQRLPEHRSATSAAVQPAVRIRVTDTGVGIQAADLALLFQPFRQIDSGLSRRYDGTGLGLVICRRLAELMGGAIEAESRFGAGSTFTVTLPLEGAAPA